MPLSLKHNDANMIEKGLLEEENPKFDHLDHRMR